MKRIVRNPCGASSVLSYTGALCVLTLTAVFIAAIPVSARGLADLAGIALIGLALGFSIKLWAFPTIMILWAAVVASLAVTGSLHDSDTTAVGLVVLYAILTLPPAWLGALAGLLVRTGWGSRRRAQPTIRE